MGFGVPFRVWGSLWGLGVRLGSGGPFGAPSGLGSLWGLLGVPLGSLWGLGSPLGSGGPHWGPFGVSLGSGGPHWGPFGVCGPF